MSGHTASFGARAVSGFVEIKILFVDLLKFVEQVNISNLKHYAKNMDYIFF